MACGGCSKRAAARAAKSLKPGDLFGGYSYLNDRQIKARLEAYKLRYCSNCTFKERCDYQMYLKCPTKQGQIK
jgi:hypothetical protein